MRSAALSCWPRGSRIVTTADQTRRRIERDLHDGAQQRLVTLTMKLRRTGGADAGSAGRAGRGAGDRGGPRRRARRPARDRQGAASGDPVPRGLGPALKALARRSPVPVELDVRTHERLPRPVEVAAYYVVAEALTNAAKYAHASVSESRPKPSTAICAFGARRRGGRRGSRARNRPRRAHRSRRGSGRQLTLHSPPGGGTTLRIDLPLA